MGLGGTHICIPLAPSAEPDETLFTATPDVNVCTNLDRENKLQ